MREHLTARSTSCCASLQGVFLLLAPALTAAELQKILPGDTFAVSPSRYEALYAGDEPLPKFYHTSKDLRSFVARLAAPGPDNCQGLSLIRSTFPNTESAEPKKINELKEEAAWNYVRTEGESVLDTIIISRLNGTVSKTPFRYALFFGEHGRELISAEVGMYLLKAFCGHAGVDSEVQKRAQHLLSYAEILILPNVDESGRHQAERGMYCDRENFDQVDLNRNWDYGWDSNVNHGNYPGSKPFSEPETQIARKHLEAFKPNAFLSIHSGDQALWTPGAYDIDDTAAKERKGAAVWKTLLDISSHVKDYTHCDCKIGAPGKLANIRHPGTSIDYAGLKMNVPYAMAWEIWLEHSRDCLPHFSPAALEEYKRVLQKWSLAIVYFGEATTAALRGLTPASGVLSPPQSSTQPVAPLAVKPHRTPNRHRQRVVPKHVDSHDQLEPVAGASSPIVEVKAHQQPLRRSASPVGLGEPVHLRSSMDDVRRRTVLSYVALIFLALIAAVTVAMFWHRQTLSLKK